MFNINHTTMKKLLLSILILTGINVFGNAPVADCDADFEFTVSGLTVTFTDISAADPGPILSWNWNFGDGTTSTEENPTHTYAEPGEYDVCLTIHADGGCFDEKCESNIEVGLGGADCFANFDYEFDGATFFFASNTDPGPGDVDSYMWTFGDGSISDAENPTHTYAEPGVYNVCLVVHFASGCVAEFCNEIVVEGGGGGDCVVNAEVVGTDGLSKHFVATVTPEPDEVTYTWFFGDGTTFTETTAGGASDPWHEYAEPGTYNVCVVIETGAGCVDEYCFEIVVEAPGGGDCDADFEWDADGLTVHFIETADGGDADIISYYWEFGDGATSDAMNPFHTYDVADHYEVCLTIVTAEGCISTFCDEINVEEAGGTCAASYVVTSTELTPDGWVVHFENTSTSAADITSTTWYFGDATIGETFDAEHLYTESGVYAVCLVISTADGCTDEYCFELFVGGGEGDCEANFEFDTDMLTASFFENADGGGSDIVSYTWSFGDGETSDALNPEHTYDVAGTYLVCLTIVTADSCISTLCEEIDVEGEGGDCEAKFDVTSITETGSGWVIVLNNNSTGSEIYHWNFGDGGTSESENPDHLFELPGVYNICLQIGIEGGDCFDEKCEEVVIGGDDCINETAIDSTYGCIDVYEPVCGCDGITYTNSCHAIYYAGVVFYTDGACATTTIQEENIFGTVKLSPNPATYSTTLSYALKESGLVQIEIMDITGSIVLSPITHPSVAGNYTIQLNTQDLSSGIYIIRLTSNGNEVKQKLMITK